MNYHDEIGKLSRQKTKELELEQYKDYVLTSQSLKQSGVYWTICIVFDVLLLASLQFLWGQATYPTRPVNLFLLIFAITFLIFNFIRAIGYHCTLFEEYLTSWKGDRGYTVSDFERNHDTNKAWGKAPLWEFKYLSILTPLFFLIHKLSFKSFLAKKKVDFTKYSLTHTMGKINTYSVYYDTKFDLLTERVDKELTETRDLLLKLQNPSPFSGHDVVKELISKLQNQHGCLEDTKKRISKERQVISNSLETNSKNAKEVILFREIIKAADKVVSNEAFLKEVDMKLKDIELDLSSHVGILTSFTNETAILTKSLTDAKEILPVELSNA